jgi:hypothetical protein
MDSQRAQEGDKVGRLHAGAPILCHLSHAKPDSGSDDRATGLQIQILNASSIGEIDAAFAAFANGRPDALFAASDAFFTSRSAQFAALTARDKIPATIRTNGL